MLSTATRGGGWVAKFGHRPGVRLKRPRFKRGGEIYTLRPQSITIAAGVRGNGGIQTHYEKLCYELINYAVRIVYGLFHLICLN